MIAAICDDDEIFRKDIKNFLIEYKKARRLHLDIVEFSNGQEMLDYEYDLDVVFLDCEMSGLSGIETARALRKSNSMCCIMIVSNYPEYVFDSFEVNTYRYFLKPIEYSKLELAIDTYIKEKKKMSPIVVTVDGGHRTVSSKEIVYLEADGKYCNIITEREKLHSSKTITKAFELLPQHCYFRIHKAYVVNMYYIQSIKDNCVFLTNGDVIDIGRTRAADFRMAYKEFIKHYIASM